MKTDCLMELERLHNEVEGKILSGTLLYNLANGAAGESVELNGDKPISESEFNYWQPLREYSWGLLESDLPRRLAYELKSNLMEATDKRQVYVTYKAEIEKWIRIDSDRAYREYTERLTDFVLPEATKKRYLSIMGELVCWYDEGITKPTTLCLGEIERDYLGEPQQQANSKPPLMQITDEALDGLKEYFVATFKGMGNNPDRFNENLVPALRRCQTKKQVAELALACYHSASMIQKKKPGSWNKWVDVWCKLFSIDRLPYKMNELPPPDYYIEYYWLKIK